MNFEQRIKSLQPYVLQMRFANGTAVVDVVFKDGWGVPQSKLVSAVKGEDKDLNYYMFYTEKEDLGLDDVLDFIEQVININIEREKKYELLKVKTEELKEVFKKNSLNKLLGMKFVLGGEKLIPDIMPNDFDNEITISDVDPAPIENIVEDKPIEVKKPTEEVSQKKIPNRAKVGNQKIELPPKGSIELEDYTEPELVCKCIGDEVCPVCVDEKLAI